MEPVNLSASCGELPSGGELAQPGYSGNLTITVEGVLSWTEPMRWGLRVRKPTVTKSGRVGKPRPVTMLVATEDQSVPDLLRALARMWEIGEVVPGQTYDGEAT